MIEKEVVLDLPKSSLPIEIEYYKCFYGHYSSSSLSFPLIMMSSIVGQQLIDDILMIKEMKGKKFSMDLDMC
jgi:hypothetical protein